MGEGELFLILYFFFAQNRQIFFTVCVVFDVLHKFFSDIHMSDSFECMSGSYLNQKKVAMIL